MIVTVKIEKEDVKTFKIGVNYGINVTDQFQIVFSPEAIEELYNDYEHLRQQDKTNTANREEAQGLQDGNDVLEAKAGGYEGADSKEVEG